MGCIKSITAFKFPKQTEYVNRRVKVYFHYKTDCYFMGTILRDDIEEPCETIIKLDDGRILRAAECQYSIMLPIKEG